MFCATIIKKAPYSGAFFITIFLSVYAAISAAYNAYTAKLSPQAQVRAAFGFTKLKPLPFKPSL